MAILETYFAALTENHVFRSFYFLAGLACECDMRCEFTKIKHDLARITHLETLYENILLVSRKKRLIHSRFRFLNSDPAEIAYINKKETRICEMIFIHNDFCGISLENFLQIL